MKKIFLVLFSLAALHTVNAQLKVPGAAAAISNFIAPPALGDIGKTAAGIGDLLTSQLTLPAAKKAPLTDAVGSFLNEKQKISGLAKTNPTQYLSKFNPLQTNLFGKMKGIMGAAAFTKFLGMKPSGKNIASNTLSNLFF